MTPEQSGKPHPWLYAEITEPDGAIIRYDYYPRNRKTGKPRRIMKTVYYLPGEPHLSIEVDLTDEEGKSLPWRKF